MNYFWVFSIEFLIKCFNLIVEVIYLPIDLYRLFTTLQKCPPIQNDLLLIPAVELARRIRRKELKSVIVVQAYIKRIEEVNPLINAVIENRFQEALKEAEKVNEILENFTEQELETKYPLLGVPITIKGSIAVKGMDHTSGMKHSQRRAAEDAVSVKRVRDAGAIPLLVSNVPELCLNWETSNKLIGSTANPYDTRRTPGGSSGGEASLLGCGASLIGVGSDIAGSLRLPAHYCGIWAHKPSPHVVSSVGHYPDCKNKDEWNRVFTLGPMARYVSDLKLLLSILAESEVKNVLKLDQTTDVKKIKVYYMKDPRSSLAKPMDFDVLAAYKKVIKHFDTICDRKCEKVEIPLMKRCSQLSYLSLLTIQGVDHCLENPDNLLREIEKFLIGQSSHEFTSLCFYTFNEYVPKMFSKLLPSVNKSIQKLRNEFLKILGEDGVFILPTSPSPATFKKDVYRVLFNGGNLSIFNCLGFPATSCPVMFSSNEIPVGIQIVAAPNCDHLNLAVAEEIEKTFGGWTFEKKLISKKTY